MDGERSLVLRWTVLAFLVVIFTMPFSRAYTYERDVYAINSLFGALGSPPLPGWVPNGGDPCGASWQGVGCVNSNITSITINGANLGGQLGDDLGNFSSIITIDLSNNNIGGSIPENLPVTMQKFFLSANQFTGSIPSSLSKLTLLTDMSLNNNHLTEELPDAFQSLTGLINLHIQNNELGGTLNVLEDLPLKDLDIENNLFSGPVPEKLLAIPKFKKDGNPFNTSIAPSPMLSPPPSPLSGAPSTDTVHANSSSSSSSSSGPTAQQSPAPKRKIGTSTIKIVGYVLVAVVSLIIVALSVMFCISKYEERKSRTDELSKSVAGRAQRVPEEHKNRNHLVKPSKEVGKVSESTSDKKIDHVIDLEGTDELVMPLPPPPPPPPPPVERVTVNLVPPPASVERVIVNPVASPEYAMRNTPPEKVNAPTSVSSFAVSSLQQYTNSFREDNLMRESRLGKVYLAELPSGTLLEVMKIDNVNSRIEVDDFLELVLNISELRHPNILELVGYCAEFGQRLLVYKHFSRKTLQDVLHCNDDLSAKLSWNARLCIALEAAKGLEYLHEGCQTPIVHQNFEPACILLNGKLAVRVCECGLAPLMSSNSVTQLSGRMHALLTYEAPEVNESGLYTDRSDIYSFGVVMLELLTGRKPYDSSRPRQEQHLVRWASSQLHDINALLRMVDPSIQGKCSEKSLSRFADIISRCIQQGPEFRPPISEVVQDLSCMINDSREPIT
ncbi:Protein STRUBBELIG-RECEPTOR FAMILY 3 [Ananas comosus]|uniref:Protein STRUBBELIG-RECEPTOR FAMILY 3 n=1 Tax=Ananas comosus TaxID=4615 RepID=A0A199V611_ANACO|nr:Protein STRUBBELIG-RECEPTOR FAMILY 3 [Ananas comosus]